MFTSIVLSRVKKELELVGFSYDGELVVTNVNGNIWTLKIYNERCNYILKYSDDSNYCFSLEIYDVLEKYGIKTDKCVVKSDKLLVFEDVVDSFKYRKAEEKDLLIEDVVKGLAKWYRKLHDISCDSTLDDEFFTLHNVLTIMEKCRLVNDRNLLYIYRNFDNIKMKFERLNCGGVCLDFSLERLMISDDFKDVFMVGNECFKVGNTYSNVKSILDLLSDECKNIFIKEYGGIKDDVIVASYIVSNVVDLYKAVVSDSFSKNSRDFLSIVCGDKFYECVRNLVEWY